MLPDKNLLPLPSYDGKTSTKCRVRCPGCGARYFVFTGARDFGRVYERARAKAEKTGAKFIDVRQTPFVNCGCGQALDFTPGDVCELVM